VKIQHGPATVNGMKNCGNPLCNRAWEGTID